MTPQLTPEVAKRSLLELYKDEGKQRRRKERSELCRVSFRDFVADGWETVEPAKAFMPSWHIDAIADHMQAIDEGHIRNLLITVPPGSAKSIIVSVMYPAWVWTHNAKWRCTFSSYDAGLSTRDSVRCRQLLESSWYLDSFKPDWQFDPVQNEKTYYMNTAKGFRVSTSVGGRGTGWRGDSIVCLLPDTLISTDCGQLRIQDIVDRKLPVKVVAFDHASGEKSWREIEKYESSEGRPSVCVRLSTGGELRLTEDHLVYVQGTGYIKASSLKSGMRLLDLRSGSVPPVKLDVAGPTERYKVVEGIGFRGPNYPKTLERNDVCGRRVFPQFSSGSIAVLAGESISSQCGPPLAGPVLSVRPRLSASPMRAPGPLELNSEPFQPAPIRAELCPSIAIRNAEHDLAAMAGSINSPAHLALSGAVGHAADLAECPAEQFSTCEATFSHSFFGAQSRAIFPVAVAGEHKELDPACLAGPHDFVFDIHNSSKVLYHKDNDNDNNDGIFVVSVEPIDTPKRVFNIRVAVDHNYFAEGVLVHNCDDPLNASDQFSDAALDQCVFWWDNVIFNRLNDMRTGTKVIIMQRICDRDLAGHWLRSGACEHLMIPMEYDPVRSKVTTLGPGKEWRDPRTYRDELMFPALFPRAVIDEIKRDPARFAGQYQQAPNVEGGGILKAHKWNYWQPPGAGLPAVRVRLPDGTIEERRAVDLPDVFDLELQTWDMAVKDLKSSDYVVGQVHAVRGANRYIRSQTRDRMDLPTTILAIRKMSGDYPRAHLKLIEDKANGPAAIQMLRGEISGMVEVNPEGGKVSRASGASIELEAGNWFLPHPMIAPWVGEPDNPTKGGFLAETILFPNGQNDDCVDAWSQGAIRIKQEKIGGAFGVSEQDIRVDPIAIGDNWPRIFGLSIDWQEVAAIWLARKPDTGEHYLYVEYDAPVSDPTQHAGEILKRGDWIHGVMAAKDTGRQQRDGYAIVQKYKALRLNLDAVQENWDTAVLEMQEALRTGKLKVFSNLPRFFDQYRLFRRDSRDKLPEDNAGLIWAACTAWRARAKMKAPAVPKKDTGRGYSDRSVGNGWMAG